MRSNQWGLLTAAVLASAPALAAPLAVAPSLPLQRVDQGVMSAVQKPDQVVIHNNREWKALWARHRRFEKAGAPRIDFTKQQVLGVFLGSRPTGGYAVRIVSARADGGKLVVTAEEQKPKPGMLTTEALTAPFCLVAVPKSTLPVKWVVQPGK